MSSATGVTRATEQSLDDTIALLDRTPAVLDALLRGLPDVWTRGTEGEGTWHAFDIVAHLIHGERTDWMPRVNVMLQFGEAKTFEPFDQWGQVRESQGKTMAQLLDEFGRLRSDNLRTLRALNLQPQQLALRGSHPSLGVVSLSQLLATWAVHDLTHIHQISRVLAHQYRETVGPWVAYLGVLHCEGHSNP